MRRKFLECFVICCLICSCHQKKNFFPDDFSLLNVPIERFDSAFLTADSDSQIKALYLQYPTFFPIYVQDILGINPADTTYIIEAIRQFRADTLYGFKQTNQLVLQTFADISPIQAELNEAFSRIHYLYIDAYIPTIYFIVSGFNCSLLFVPNLANEDIAVGVDMYLGETYEYYNQVVYNYQKHTMQPQFIAGDIVSAWLFRNIPFTSDKSRLIDNMIYRGKLMFTLQQLLPNEHPWDIMGYTQEQWQWAEQHEQAIWHYMIDRKDIFSTNSKLLTAYLNDGPFTAEISQECPPRIGTWIGWRITESYMQNNANVSLQSLLQNGNTQEILEQSNYR